MCFSATASFTAGTFLLWIGILTLRQVRHKYMIAFASLPLIFWIHQIIEGMVWISFHRTLFHSVAVFLFVVVAYSFWPMYVPIAVGVLEHDPRKRKIFFALSLLGVITGAYILTHVISTQISSSIVGNSICYQVPVSYPEYAFVFYFLVIGFSLVLSSSQKIRIFGTLVLFSFFIAHRWYPETSFSVWCFFAALLSCIVYFYIQESNTTKNNE